MAKKTTKKVAKKATKKIAKKTAKKATKKTTKKKVAKKASSETQSDEEKKIGRRRRAKFRPEFKDRSLKSFSMSVFYLEDISDILKGSDEEIDGFNLVSSCSSLAHAFEMLSKAILKRVSPYLLLTKLDQFDSRTQQLKDYYKNLSNSSEDKASYCVGRVAFARALKLLKKPLEAREVSLVLGVINKRNIFEHRDNAHIVNYDNFLEELVEAMRVFQNIYTREFRNADLFKDIKEVSNLGGLDRIFDVLDKHFSDRMKKILAVKKKKEISGVKFSQCRGCHFDLAEIKLKNQKECLWCGHKEALKKCSVKECNKYMWTSDTKEVYCRLHHSQKLLDASIESFRATAKLNDNLSKLVSTSIKNQFEDLDFDMSFTMPTIDIELPSIDLKLPHLEIELPETDLILPELNLGQKKKKDDEDTEN